MNRSDQDYAQSGFASGLFFGLVLGGTLGYFLSTDAGQDFLQKFKQTAVKVLETDQFQDKLEQTKALVEKLETKLDPPSSPKPTRVFRKDGQPLKPKL